MRGLDRFTRCSAGQSPPSGHRTGRRSRSDRTAKEPDLYLKPSSGAGSEQLLWNPRTRKRPLLVVGRPVPPVLTIDPNPRVLRSLWTQPMTGDRKPSPWLNTRFTETRGSFRRMATGWPISRTSQQIDSRSTCSRFRNSGCKVADLDRWRNDAAMAGGREGTVLHCAGREADGGSDDDVFGHDIRGRATGCALSQTRIVGGPNQILSINMRSHATAASRSTSRPRERPQHPSR